MRRQLILVFGAVSLMVAIAFLVPLAFLVRSTAEDRAIDAARADAAAVVPALIADVSQAQIESAVGATASGRAGYMTVVTSKQWIIGAEVTDSVRLDAALTDGASSIGPVDGGVEVVTAVATGPGELSAVRVFVPSDDLYRGQTQAWTALALVAIALVGLSVLVADRLARSIVRPTQKLALAAQDLGAGDLETRVEPAGPPELVELSNAFNSLGAQVSSMLARERELVAELSHRLRTPLTKLRMRLEQVDDETLSAELRADLDDVTNVVNNLIAEARSTLTPPSQTCDAAAIVTARVEFWSALAEDQHRAWSFEPDAADLTVTVSESELSAAVDVLIDNVFAHTADGTDFAVGYSRRGAFARIWVSDSGTGFDPARQSRGTSGSGSTGLGLDIARSLAETAGGTFDIGQSPLGGAEVSLLLPVVQADA